jgi:hypothetical protein
MTSTTAKTASSARKKATKKSGGPAPWNSLSNLIECGKKSPYLWSLPAGVATHAIADRLSGWCSASMQKGAYSAEALADFKNWVLVDAEPHALEAVHALQGLWLVKKLAEQGETELAEQVVARAERIQQEGAVSTTETAWHQFLCEVELPLALAAVGQKTKVSAKGLAQSIQSLIDEICDTDGVPHSSHLAFLRPILGSWIRSLAFASHLGVDLRKKKLQALYDAFFEQCLRFSTFEKHAMGCEPSDFDFSKRMFQLGLETCQDDDAPLLAGGALGVGRKPTVSTLDGLVTASAHSEWGSIALLRTHWTRMAAKLLIDYEGTTFDCHLDTFKSVLKGQWELRIDKNGKQVSPESDWSLVCWHDDDDGIYIELERTYTGGCKVQRQIFLGSEDAILFSGDAVFFDEPCEWDYRSSLPLGPGVELVGAEESREGHLVHHDENGATTNLGLVIPLSLPEWRQESVDAGLQQEGHDLIHFGHRSRARGYFPLFLDLNPVRSQNALTWRRLTVGESLEICTDDIAVAYRVQVGHEQWVFYRALNGISNRTFFGQNLFADFFAGQFDTDGQMNELISINEEDAPL